MAGTAIILVNWNGWQDSIACIRSCLALAHDDFRIILCDNASKDGSVEKIVDWAEGRLDVPMDPCSPVPLDAVARPRGVALLDRASAEAGDDGGGAQLLVVPTGGNLGFAGGNNVGLRWALARGCEHAWLLNNDTVVPPDCLTRLEETLRRHPKAGLCGSALVHYEKPDTVQALCGALDLRHFGGRHVGLDLPLSSVPGTDVRAMIKRYEVLYPVGASLLATRAFLQDIGLMEEAYFLYFEESDWVLRARGRFDIALAPDSLVYHHHGASAGTSSDGRNWRSMAFLYRSRVLIARKFAPWRLPSVVFTIIKDSTKALIRGRSGKMRGAIAALSGRAPVPSR